MANFLGIVVGIQECGRSQSRWSERKVKDTGKLEGEDSEAAYLKYENRIGREFLLSMATNVIIVLRGPSSLKIVASSLVDEPVTRLIVALGKRQDIRRKPSRWTDGTLSQQCKNLPKIFQQSVSFRPRPLQVNGDLSKIFGWDLFNQRKCV
ncbi:hypothetical protein GALMADRAFT_243432 [Galerina marginata CBS 339.88]|uniref:Uncharacterized protein n=1 Tax=Galerina marginata (strain CBS 339.88) TaxID=685588 RepID=A0A067T8D4_GALM3|nr:hypothetical protein GALMADRAFT_243432 [Galerina marginata CBS 339.88]